MAKRDRDRIFGQLVTALTHRLKWQHQPEMRSGAWRSAVVKARDRIARLVNDSPSLRAYPAKVLVEAYPPARRAAEAETVAPNDIQRMHAAAARLYSERSISTIERWSNTIERWSNPDTKNSGEV